MVLVPCVKARREGLLGMLTGLPPHSAGFIARLEVWHGKERLIDPYP